MAALRHAARRLCERSLSSPGRRLMSNSSVSGKPQTFAGPHSELRMEFEEKKQELFDLCAEMRTTGAFKTYSWENLQNLRLISHLAAQVKPKPQDPIWWTYRRNRYVYDFVTGYFCLGFLAYNFLGSNKKEGEGQGEANIVSHTEPTNQ